MKCIVIDDESSAQLILTQLCEQNKDLQLLRVFSNSAEAVNYLKAHEVDLILLDVLMPGLTGFEVLEESGTRAQVILTTAYIRFAEKSYEFENVAGYLVKPIDPVRFTKAINQVKKRIPPKSQKAAPGQPKTKKEFLVLNIDRRLTQIPVDDILFVEAERDYVQIQTKQILIRAHASLKTILEKLPQARFMQIHRSFLVNIEHISEYKRNNVSILNYLLPVSRSHRPGLIKRLSSR